MTPSFTKHTDPPPPPAVLIQSRRRPRVREALVFFSQYQAGEPAPPAAHASELATRELTYFFPDFLPEFLTSDRIDPTAGTKKRARPTAGGARRVMYPTPFRIFVWRT
eukprot:710549-Prorocentrum_minimum.AAC.1